MNDAWLLKVDSNGCEVMNCMLNTSVEEEIPGFKVYPNPANDILHFQSPAQRITDLRIYDISGKELLHFEPGEMHFTVPVSGLVSGIYLYRITGGNGETVTGKFVRE